jgi:two-component system response regulator ResD
MNEKSTQHILVVDDDPTSSDVVARYLRGDGFEVAVTLDGQTALDQATESYSDLVVLDLMLPKIDRLEVCRLLRDLGDVPIIMLTAKGKETDRLLGLSLGADDYLTKPFSPRELVARVKAVLQRTAGMPPPLEGGALPKRTKTRYLTGSTEAKSRAPSSSEEPSPG